MPNKSVTTLRTRVSPGPGRPGNRTASLIVIYGEGLGTRIDVDASPILVGRSDEADLQLPHPSVSRRHCQIWQESQDYLVRDLQATNCTRVNDEDLGDDTRILADGDHITVGESILKFVGHSSVEAPYHEELYQLATHDALTELCNRRHFDELLTKEIARTSRHRRELSLAIVDVDLFKSVNDDHGHVEGDGVLRRIADTIRHHARVEDEAARIGGEEFAIVFPETGPLDARAICERLRQAVADIAFRFNGSTRSVTVSIGIAALHQGDTPKSLLRRADQALYQAKDSGRNQTCIAQDPDEKN